MFNPYIPHLTLSFILFFLLPLYYLKFGRSGFTIHRITLLLCCFSLLFKASGHVWCSDGAGRDYGGFDYSKGNANVITTLLFLYGEMQYVWVFWNLMFLFYDSSWIKTAIRLHLFVGIFMFSFILGFWPYIKEYPVISPPVGDAKRPGNYLWIIEVIFPFFVTLYDIIIYKKNSNIK